MSVFVPTVGSIGALPGSLKQGVNWNIPELGSVIRIAQLNEEESRDEKRIPVGKSPKFNLKSSEAGSDNTHECRLLMFYDYEDEPAEIHVEMQSTDGRKSDGSKCDLGKLVKSAHFQGQAGSHFPGHNYDHYVRRSYTLVKYFKLDTALLHFLSKTVVAQLLVRLKSFEFTKAHVPITHSSFNAKQLLGSHKWSDFQFIVGGKVIPVHKAILAPQSQVFDRMFDAEMTESASGQLKIVDFSMASVECFANYLYGCAETDQLEQHAVELLRLADKYAVLPMKRELEQLLCENIDVESVCELLISGDVYGAWDLKHSCIQFILGHKEEVVASSQWDELWTKRNALAAEVMAADCWMPPRKRQRVR